MRTFSFVNLAGLLALVVLCISQWQDNRQYNQEINRLENIRIDLTKNLAERDSTINGQREDYELFSSQITDLTGDLTETKGLLRTEELKTAQLESERNQLRENVKKWALAVEERDTRIKDNHEKILGLARDLNEIVLQYNELATNYNNSVKLLNERSVNYNELVSRYNELAQPSAQRK